MRVLEGRETVLRHAALLEQLAQRCGDHGAMNWLAYFMEGAGARWKRPCVVLFLSPAADPHASRPQDLQPQDLRAAALFYQLAPWGVPTRAYATDDWEGRRTVTAPAAIRGEVTAMAMEALLQQGAHVVLVTYPCTEADPVPVGERLQPPHLLWAEHSREIRNTQLRLDRTFEETLARFGKQTRFNLRYYRKRLLARIPCDFIPDVCAVMSEDECVAMNANSLNPVPAAECRRRFRASRDLPGGFLIGLRGPHGSWLSVLGGWRQATTTVMYYQINSAHYEKDSLNTVMRSFFLEDEAQRGTQKLVFYHGTNHPMWRAFDHERVCDLIVRRRSVRAWILRRSALLIATRHYYTTASHFGGSTTFFAAVLTSDAMIWRSTSQTSRAQPSGAGFKPSDSPRLPDEKSI